MSNLEQEVRADLSLEQAYAHMTFLVEQIGERLAGTQEIDRAAQYIAAQLEAYGLEARVDQFPIYHSYPGSAALRVVSPEERVIEALPSCHIPSTLEEGLSGELVYAGAGGYEDYEGAGVRGKIVLVDMTWAPPRPEKARIAWEKGAKALIISNWGTPDNPVIQRGAIKSVWGNPTPESMKQIPQIPVINITRGSGEYLRKLYAAQKVRVWLRADATREWVSARQPVGVLHTQNSNGAFVLVGGHLEAWGQTAICNASGNALTLELARVLGRHRDNLQRDIVFAFWDGHEIAEAAGSTYYVDTHWDALARNCVAYVNIDNPGIVGTSVPEYRSALEVKTFMRQIVQEHWGQHGNWKMPYKGGDQSFFGVGVPYISFATGYTPEELERLNWASLSPWLHSEADTLDKIDAALYEKHLHFFANLVVRLCNASIIPYDLAATVTELTSQLRDLQELSAGIPADLKELISAVGQLSNRLQQFEQVQQVLLHRDRDAETTHLINKTLIKVSRELSVLWTEAGRYDQDPYGYYLIGKPVPRLYAPLVRMKGLTPNQEAYQLWMTKLVRERNRVSDIISATTEHLALVTSLGKQLMGEDNHAL